MLKAKSAKIYGAIDMNRNSKSWNGRKSWYKMGNIWLLNEFMCCKCSHLLFIYLKEAKIGFKLNHLYDSTKNQNACKFPLLLKQKYIYSMILME